MSGNQIDYLPAGWVWMYKGEQEWTTSRGKTSVERHGYNTTTKETLSTRQVQNIQRKERADQGAPKAVAVPRTGKTRTTFYGAVGTKGQRASLAFRNLEDVEAYVRSGQADWAEMAYLKIKYDSKSVGNDDSPPSDKAGYTAISPWTDVSFYKQYAGTNILGKPEHQDLFGGDAITNPWIRAEIALQDYGMRSKRARYYLVLQEND